MCTIVIGSFYNFRFRSYFFVLCFIKVKLSVNVKLYVFHYYVFVCILPGKTLPEMTYTVSGGTLNPTHSPRHPLTISRFCIRWDFLVLGLVFVTCDESTHTETTEATKTATTTAVPRYFQTSAKDILFRKILTTKFTKQIRDFFEYASYKFDTLLTYLLTYLLCV